MTQAYAEFLRDYLPLITSKALIIVLLLIGFYVASKILCKLVVVFSNRFKLELALLNLFKKITNSTLLILAIITILGTLGINVSALVAGLGLTGFALGFALKDIISNLLSGLLILLYRPFVIGDHIKISGFEGKVIEIDLRYTKLEQNGNILLIPNSKLFVQIIKIDK